ncbi:MAG TPA: hypothetical protein DD708_07735 [Deltaproteobacteria bacterium]|nr:hypothetical protein [Deltaproteobacteria bacterium]
MEKEPPIFTKIHKGKQLGDEKIAEGFETGEMDGGRGIRRKKFETEDGYFYYVDRSLQSEYEAVRVMQIYQLLKDAGLPVVDFAKTIRKKIDGKIKFFLAMEDLTEDDKFTVTEVYNKTPQLIAKSSNPSALQEQMIWALAVMHNNEVVDFHPGLSFALRTQPREEDQQEAAVDFRIIDYPNLTKGGFPKGWSGGYNFKAECSSDVRQLLEGIVFEDSQKQHLENLYRQIRESENKIF